MFKNRLKDLMSLKEMIAMIAMAVILVCIPIKFNLSGDLDSFKFNPKTGDTTVKQINKEIFMEYEVKKGNDLRRI